MDLDRFSGVHWLAYALGEKMSKERYFGSWPYSEKSSSCTGISAPLGVSTQPQYYRERLHITDRKMTFSG